MSIVEEHLKKIEIGRPIFEKLFNLKKEQLLSVVGKIVGAHRCSNVLTDGNTVYKTIDDDVPNEIKIASWDTIIITPLGIYYQPEHRERSEVVLFTEFFKLDI